MCTGKPWNERLLKTSSSFKLQQVYFRHSLLMLLISRLTSSRHIACPPGLDSLVCKTNNYPQKNAVKRASVSVITKALAPNSKYSVNMSYQQHQSTESIPNRFSPLLMPVADKLTPRRHAYLQPITTCPLPIPGPPRSPLKPPQHQSLPSLHSLDLSGLPTGSLPSHGPHPAPPNTILGRGPCGLAFRPKTPPRDE